MKLGQQSQQLHDLIDGITAGSPHIFTNHVGEVSRGLQPLPIQPFD